MNLLFGYQVYIAMCQMYLALLESSLTLTPTDANLRSRKIYLFTKMASIHIFICFLCGVETCLGVDYNLSVAAAHTKNKTESDRY